jgi:hypothetical protein
VGCLRLCGRGPLVAVDSPDGERLYGDLLFADAFAVASALSLLALVTLILKTLAEWKNRRQFEAGQRALLEPTIEGATN